MSKLLDSNEWVVRYLCSWFGEGWDIENPASTEEVLSSKLEDLELEVLVTIREGLGRLIPLVSRLGEQEAALELAKLGIYFRCASEKRNAHEWVGILQKQIEAEWLSRKR